MTSTLGINDSQPRNLEAPRSTELLPDQIRVTATNFMTLLTEYYKFMNINEWATVTTATPTSTVLSGKSGSGPSNVLYSILTELDSDLINSDYLAHLQNTVAPYVPLPTYMTTASTSTLNTAMFYKHLTEDEMATMRAILYKKIIKYFYNTRGSRNSVTSFFRLFYNDTAGIYDANDFSNSLELYIKDWLTTSGMALSATTVGAGPYVYGQTPIQAWLPFSYVITTAIDKDSFDTSYRALVHPIGFKYLVQPTQSSDNGIEVPDSRMVCARVDYQKALWFLDTTKLEEFANFAGISDAAEAYFEANQNTISYTYADWSNIGSKIEYNIKPANALGLSAPTWPNTYYLTSPTGIPNALPGMLIRNATSVSAIVTTGSGTLITGVSTVNANVSNLTYNSGTTSLTLIGQGNTSIVPGIFVSGSGITTNTYVTSASYSGVSGTKYGYAYSGDNTLVYSGSTLDSSIFVGSVVNDSTLFTPASGTITSLQTPTNPQVVYTYATSSTLSNGNLDMIVRVGKKGPISSSSLDAFGYVSAMWNSGSNAVYVSGGPSTFGNYNVSNGYIYVSAIDSVNQTITLKKSNNTTFSSAITSLGSGSTVGYGIHNNNVIVFCASDPGAVTVGLASTTTAPAFFGGGGSYPAGWYRITYLGGANNEASDDTPDDLMTSVVYDSGAAPITNGLNGTIHPLRILGSSQQVVSGNWLFGNYIKTPYASQADLEASYYAKYVDFYHPGGRISQFFRDTAAPNGYGDNRNGYPNPVLAISRPPGAKLSSVANASSTGSISFINQLVTISSPTTTSASSANVLFYGQVISTDKANSGQTNLTDELILSL